MTSREDDAALIKTACVRKTNKEQRLAKRVAKEARKYYRTLKVNAPSHMRLDKDAIHLTDFQGAA